MTGDHLREASATCERMFAYLVAEFGYHEGDLTFRASGFSLRYFGTHIGVLIEWYPRDPLTVWLVKLVDGGFPSREVAVRPTTPLHYFHLGDVVAISGDPRSFEDSRFYGLPNENTVKELAVALRQYGSDFLAGELARIPRLEERVKDRASSVEIERFGEGRARELGW